jgi:hypothetical protein
MFMEKYTYAARREAAIGSGIVVIGTGVRRGAAIALAVSLLSWTGAASASDIDLAIVEWFEAHSLPVPSRWNMVLCHGFDCAFRTQVALSEVDRAKLGTMMRAATPEAERRGLAQALAWFDRRFAPAMGTAKAKARAANLAGHASQFDCIDRTSNTMSLIRVLDQLGMLRHHRLVAPATRHFLTPHTSAVMIERKGNRKWVVDPWTHNSGERPDVMPLEVWVGLD